MTSQENEPFNLLILGKSGNGKSALGNHLLNKQVFKSRRSPSSVTKRCQREEGHIGNRPIVVVDTPGTMDTHLDPDELMKHLAEATVLSPDGYHAFLLVFSSITRITAEEKEAVEIIAKLFGRGFFKYAIFVFTFGNVFNADLKTQSDQLAAFEDYINDLDPEMKAFIGRCQGGYILVNAVEGNEALKKNTNVEILGMVEDLVTANKGRRYTNEYFEAVQEQLIQKQKHELEMKRMKEELEEQKLKQKYLDMEVEVERVRREREWDRERLTERESEWRRDKEFKREMEMVRERERAFERERERERAFERERERERKFERERERYKREHDSVINLIWDKMKRAFHTFTGH